MKPARNRILVLSLTLTTLALMISGCGKSVSFSNLPSNSLSQIQNPSTGGGGGGGGIPTYGNGNIVCKVYDLSAYYQSQGCPNPLNTSDGSGGVNLPAVNLNSLFACGMKLPTDFSSLSPVAIVKLDNFDTSPRSWKDRIEGFPAELDYLKEWYGMSCDATLIVDSTRPIRYTINSDDGSRVYLDHKLVIDNDGVTSPRAKSYSTELSLGNHPIRVEWFQGPRHYIALELFWAHTYTCPKVIENPRREHQKYKELFSAKKRCETESVIIPPSAFLPPAGNGDDDPTNPGIGV